MSSDIKLTITPNAEFNTKGKEPFLTQLTTNIRDKFVNQLVVMDFSRTSDDLPGLYGYTEMYDIADQFSMDPDGLHNSSPTSETDSLTQTSFTS